MNHLGLSLDQWIHKVKFNDVLRIVASFDPVTLPAIASYYDFINRIIRIDEKPRSKHKKRKPSKKIGKCEAFLCDCPRRFSDPNATWGWDSHKDQCCNRPEY